MIWGVGTGRCGTASLARHLEGQHEGGPSLGDVYGVMQGHEEALEVARQAVRRRLAETTAPALVDARQSFVIPLLAEEDPFAEIHWVIRDPIDCVGSLRYRGPWLEQQRPLVGMEPQTDVEIALAYWLATNRWILRCRRALPTVPWRVWRPEQIPVHENRNPEGTEPLSHGDARLVLSSGAYTIFQEALLP